MLTKEKWMQFGFSAEEADMLMELAKKAALTTCMPIEEAEEMLLAVCFPKPQPLTDLEDIAKNMESLATKVANFLPREELDAEAKAKTKLDNRNLRQLSKSGVQKSSKFGGQPETRMGISKNRSWRPRRR